jgi:hypothetical protein
MSDSSPDCWPPSWSRCCTTSLAPPIRLRSPSCSARCQCLRSCHLPSTGHSGAAACLFMCLLDFWVHRHASWRARRSCNGEGCGGIHGAGKADGDTAMTSARAKCGPCRFPMITPSVCRFPARPRPSRARQQRRPPWRQRTRRPPGACRVSPCGSSQRRATAAGHKQCFIKHRQISGQSPAASLPRCLEISGHRQAPWKLNETVIPESALRYYYVNPVGLSRSERAGRGARVCSRLEVGPEVFDPIYWLPIQSLRRRAAFDHAQLSMPNCA